MKQYTIDVTYECNWFCPYCACDTHSQPRKNFASVLESLKDIESGSILSLSGGEPGMLTEDQLQQIVDIAKDKECSLEVITNGKIFDYPKICDAVDRFYYHCSIDMNPRGQVNRTYKDKTFFIVNVYDGVYKRMDKFLAANSDLEFTLLPTREAIVHGVAGPSLSRENAQKLLDRKDELKLSEINIGVIQRYVDTGLIISHARGDMVTL